MKIIYEYTLETLTTEFASLQQKPFRAKQVFSWLYQKQVNSFEKMSDLSKDFRQQLQQTFTFEALSLKERQVSKDGTIKYLFALSDHSLIETVLMVHEYGKSVCVTSQVGCNMKCRFCASGLLHKQRDLTPGEMVAQIMYVQLDIQDRISHVVVMGTGEPFDNYDHVMEFVRIINHPHGLAIGARHITISTCGLVDKIKQYATEGLQTNLAISLHAPNDEIRNELMPINKVFCMDDLREALKEYIDKTNRRITFEYIMLKDINDSIVCARQLAHYSKGLNAYVNLIPYNSVDEHGYLPSSSETVEAFKEELLRLHINVIVRRERGQDIDGACGQLRARRSGVE